MFVAQMAVTAAGQLVAVAYDDGADLLGIYDGRAWVWHASEALQAKAALAGRDA